MRKHLHHPIRSIGAALTLVGVLAAVVLLVAPSAVSGPGKDQVSYYTNAKGNVLQKIGEDAYFEVNGKNLDKTVEVFCWAGKEANDATGFTGWDTLTDWNYSSASKKLIDGDMDPDCDGNNGVGLKSAIMVEFEHGLVADPTDDNFVVGPAIFVKDEQKG